MRVAQEEEAHRSLLAARQPTGSGVTGAAHRDRFAPPQCPIATVYTLYPVAVVGAQVASRQHFDQVGNDRGIRAPQGLDRAPWRTGASLGGAGKDQRAQDDDDRRN